MNTYLPRWILALAALAALASSITIVSVEGRAAREPSETTAGRWGAIEHAKTMAELLSTWQERGLHGRHGVVFSRHLHFVSADAAQGQMWMGTFPIDPQLPRTAFAERASERTALWVAYRLGLVRRLTYVMPPDDYSVRLAAVRDGVLTPTPSFRYATRDDGYALYEFGFERVVTADPPSTDELVPLVVHASVMSEQTPAELAAALERSDLHSDLIVLCFAIDDDTVLGPQREALAVLGSLLERQGTAQ